MSFSSLCIHTCDVGNLAQGVKNAYGTPAETWPVGSESAACRFTTNGGKEVQVGAVVVISDWTLFVANTVEVDEQDRISNIQLASSGVVIDAGPFEVLLVKPRSNGVGEHHKELYLRKVA